VQGEGIYKTVFKNIKAAAAGQGLERVFITGVSPVVMADMSSGYNVATDIYQRPVFNTLCGFTETEMAAILMQLAQEGVIAPTEVAEMHALMRTFYNGYCFSARAAEAVYNPTLVLYFLDALQREGRPPDEGHPATPAGVDRSDPAG